MSTFKPTTLLDKIFEGGIILKGLSGVAELLGGLIMLFVTPDRLHRFISFLTEDSLTTNPHAPIANWLVHSTQHFGNGSRWFLVAYLWVHAAVKLTAVIGILKNQLWAYPFALISLSIMMLYQIWSIIFVKASLGMIALTLFDILILWLIWREYQKVKPNSTNKHESS